MKFSLRPPTNNDIDCYHEIFSDEETHHYIIEEGLQDYEGSKNKLEKLISINGKLKKVYTLDYNNNAVGFIVIHLDDSDSPFISYAVRKSYQRRGIASQAIKNLIDVENNNFNKFKAATHLENTPSQDLLLKNNFIKIGIKD